ncbi:integrase [Heyndrickxia faecalis]
MAAVQAILGHEDPETTLRYAKVTENYKKDQYKKYLVQ